MNYALSPSIWRLPESRGVSSYAFDIDQQSASALMHAGFGSVAKQRPLEELESIVSEHDLLATRRGSTIVDRAVSFLAAVPVGVSPPEVSLDPDGEVAFDWRVGDDLVSVSLGANGSLAYAWDLDDVPDSGSSKFNGSLPKELAAALSHF